MSTPQPLIRLHQVSKGFQEGQQQRQLFSGCNLSIQPGEAVALLGASGSGKSTLLNLISGIDSADSGSVYVAGQDWATLTEPARSHFRGRQLGMVFQSFYLIPLLTVQENILLVLEQNQIPQPEAAAETWLQRVGMLNHQHSYPQHLSGGEQQRVAIARALCHQPQVLLADEPTGNLDHATRSHILALFRWLHQELQQTMVIVTHSHTVASLASRQLALEAGQLVERS